MPVTNDGVWPTTIRVCECGPASQWSGAGAKPMLAPAMAHPSQQIRFCTSRDGTRIAYAICGSGPPLVRPAYWISHLNADWDSPVWSPWLSFLSKSRTLILYDQRGCGLSDREGVEFSFEKYVEDLEAVIV